MHPACFNEPRILFVLATNTTTINTYKKYTIATNKYTIVFNLQTSKCMQKPYTTKNRRKHFARHIYLEAIRQRIKAL